MTPRAVWRWLTGAAWLEGIRHDEQALRDAMHAAAEVIARDDAALAERLRAATRPTTTRGQAHEAFRDVLRWIAAGRA